MKSWMGLVVAAVLLAGCSQRIYFDTSVDANFKSYKKTFAFLPPVDSIKSALFDHGLMNENIRVAILTEMKKRSYMADTLAPELLVKFHIMVEQKENIVNNSTFSYGGMGMGGMGMGGMGMGYGMGGMMYGMGMGYGMGYYNYPSQIYMGNDIQKVDYEQGTVVVDVIERSTGKLVWRGWSIGDLQNPMQYTNELPNLIYRIFRHYPIKEG